MNYLRSGVLKAEHFQITRQFFNDPERMLNYLLEP